MKVIAIRHGETVWNTEAREMGQLDSPLTNLGQAQAEAIALRVKTMPISKIFTSDLGRAVQTAHPISVALGCEVTLDESLRERHMGIFQGLTKSEAKESYPKEWSEYQAKGAEYVIPEGESARQRLDRSVKAMTSIADNNPDEYILVVTHGGFLMGFFEYVLGLAPGNGWRFSRRNASFNVFEYSEGRWSLDVWNDTSHLGEFNSLDDPSSQT